MAFRARDQAGDQRFGQQVALIREERGRRRWKPQCRFELGCFGRADEASGVSPLGQALDAGFEFAGARGRQFDVAADGRLVFSKGETGRFPEDGEVLAALGADA